MTKTHAATTTPPQPHATAPNMDAIAERYARLEERLHPVIGALSCDICASCSEVCCQSKHCAEVVESAWHRRVAARRQADLPSPDTPPEAISFLSPTGCILTAGRPVQCTAYVCRRIDEALPDALTAFVYHVLSGLPSHVMRDATRDYHLMEVEDLSELTDAQRRRLQTRIREAEHALDVASRLLDQAPPLPPGQRTAYVLQLAAMFPFAARAAGCGRREISE